MNTKNRFNRDEISSILKRAAELEHKDNVYEDGEGLTLQELQQVSKEVGIDPKYIQKALDELNNPSQKGMKKLLGGPFSYNISDSAEQIVDDEAWEEIVSEIRRIHGGIGKTSKLGNTFEWEQRKREVGYIQISLSPKKDHTKIDINANYGYYGSMIYAFAGGFGFLLLMITLEKLGLSAIPQTIGAVSGTLGLLGIARYYLTNWMGEKRKKYNQLLLCFKEMLSPGSGNKEIDTTPSIIINADDQESQSKESAGRRQKEKTK